MIFAADEPLIRADELQLLGSHNVENAMAAAAAALASGLPREAVAEGLRSFPGVRHRLERIRERGGVLWVNDSKATNVASALAGIRAFDGGVRLIAGGRPKQESFEPLAPVVAERCVACYLIGEAVERMAAGLAPAAEAGVEIADVGTLERAVEVAAAEATPGEVVLLSPACASFDAFKDFEARGDRFRRAGRGPAVSKSMRGRAKARPVRGGKPAAPPLEYSLLLTATLCLLAFGAVMVFSASSARSLLNHGGSGFYYLERTLLFGAIGLVAMRVAAVRGVAAVKVLTPLILGVSLFFLFAVLLPGVGHQVNGSQRWIGAGILQFQPSELAKLALVLYGAFLLSKEPKRARTLGGLGPYLLIVGLALLLIAKEPDLGTTIIASTAVCCVLFLGGVRLRTLAPVGIAIAVIGVGMVAMNPYQEARLTGFLHPNSDTGGAGFQAKQATIAIGSGGMFGVGLGESVQKASYLPEAHTDMIAAVIGEELGLAGMFLLIGLFGMFGYAGLRAAHRARDRFSKLLAAGLTSLILAQAALNLFAVLGLAPLTGVPLPFVSYGGTSLVMTLAAAGLILNVARRPARAKAAGRSGSGRSRSGGSRTAGGPARLRVVEGRTDTRRKRTASNGTSRDSGRRHGGARRTGDRRRRRASR